MCGCDTLSFGSIIEIEYKQVIQERVYLDFVCQCCDNQFNQSNVLSEGEKFFYIRVMQT